MEFTEHFMKWSWKINNNHESNEGHGIGMALSVINKINNKLKKTKFLNPDTKKLLCKALIQPYSQYICPAWYPN